MKRLRMHKQKVVKSDGRWMYLYTFEEETETQHQQHEEQKRMGNEMPSARVEGDRTAQ
ncbi:MAG: hypothetical protein RMK92_03325 [Armatimonadota bacterium]|nr:hypothetical protein [Armatimonadota bacterium]